MKILALHCDYLKFKALKKALKSAEEIEQEKKEVEITEPLVIFTAVEKSDEDSIERIAELLAKNVKELAGQVKAKIVVLYPYAHLSSSLAKPDAAKHVLVKAENILKKEKYNVYRAAFGYYKEFELKCKGHPLAELSREINLSGKDVDILRNKSFAASAPSKPLSDNDIRNLLKEISKAKLDTSKLKENDHRILGQKLDLFSFNEVAPGMVFWHNNGLIIYNELINFWREEHRKAGYSEISTPQILDKKLWLISGHWEKYKDNIFLTGYEGKEMAVKPMNCPGGILIYKTRPRSYKELPMRVAELGTVHRHELSGVLGGLFRVIKFTQDDAHIYCTEEQLEKEISGIMDLVALFYKKFNFDYSVELSTRPEKRIGSDALWDRAEKTLEKVLKNKKVKYKLNKGDGAFYGPKIDFHIKDSLSRTWQCGTIQLDFAMPERFDLAYTDSDNREKKPVMIHRTVYGSLERFIGVLLEHLNGNLPVWLSPIQARVISFTDRNIKKSLEIVEKIREEGIRVDADISSTTVNSKIRDAEMMKIPYVLVIGDKEEKSKTVSVRKRGEKPKFGVKLESFFEKIKEEINERRILKTI